MSADATQATGSRYQLDSRLGAGGFGEVYRATNLESGTPVAVKVLVRQSPEALFRFKREFRSLVDLVHPNLVRLHELRRQGDRWLLVMDLVREATDFVSWSRGAALRVGEPTPTASSSTLEAIEGGPLEEVEAALAEPPRDSGRCDPDRLRPALRQLVDGVAALHRAGLLHCDLKPSNVLVDVAGRVAILDFGLVSFRAGRATDDAGSTAGVIGTPAYMAPEVAAGFAARRASDWYSVGVMIYEALSGRRPFGGSAAAAMAKRIRDAPRLEVEDAVQDLATLAHDLLQRDPAARPEARAIRAALGAVHRGPPPRVEATEALSRTVLVGRESQLSTLDAAFERTAQGALCTVLVHGEAGMGKSALIEHFLDRVRAQAPDAVVLRGRCYEHERVPFKAFDGVVDALTTVLRQLPANTAHAVLPRDIAVLARMFPVLERVPAVERPDRALAPADARASQRRAFAALRELLGRVGATRPLVIFIDDLQWGDVDSLALWEALVRPPDAPVALIVGTYRTREGGVSPLLRGILNHEFLEAPVAVELGPLDRLAAEELAQRLLGADADPERTRVIADESRGVPFFIGQLIATWVADLDAPPPTVARAVRARVARLDEDARKLLDVLAVAAGPVSHEIAGGVLGLDEARLSAAAALLRVRGLGRSGSGSDARIETYHDLIRESVSDDMQGAYARGLHLGLAERLAATTSPDPEAVTRHFEKGGDAARTVQWARLAADQASQSLAFDRAAEFFQLAIEHDVTRLPAPGARALRVSLAAALQSSGRVVDAAHALVEAAQGAPELQRLDMLRQAGECMLVAGQIDQGRALLGEVADALDVTLVFTPLRALASLLISRLRLRLRRPGPAAAHDGPPSERERLALRTLWSAAVGHANADQLAYGAVGHACFRRALASGDPALADDALSVVHITESLLTGPRARARFGRRVARWRAALGSAEAQDTPLRAQADAALEFLSGDFSAALASARLAFARIRGDEDGVTGLRNISRVMQCAANNYVGDPATILKDTAAWYADSRARGDFLSESFFRLTWNGYAAERSNDFDSGRAVIRETMARWRERTGLLPHYWEFVAMMNMNLVAGDDPVETLAYADRTWRLIKKSGVLSLRFYATEAHWLRGVARLRFAVQGATGEPEPVLRRVRADARRCDRHRSPWGSALAHGLRAGCALFTGDLDAAMNALEAAEVNAKQSGMLAFTHACRVRRGQLLGGDEGAMLSALGREGLLRLGWHDPDRYVALTVGQRPVHRL